MNLVSVQNLEKSFGSRILFKGIGFGVDEKDRIGLIGPNGAGKSTLFKILAGEMQADQGQVSFKKGLRMALLKQDPKFGADEKILSAILSRAMDPNDWEEMARAQELLARADLIRFGEDRLVKELSGGWQKRLSIVCELMTEPDLLLLDEPTNHLDIEGILWLEKLLEKSSTATMTITHDRVFLQKIANRIIEINPRFPDGLLSVHGSYLHFLEAKESELQALVSQETKLRNTLRRETEWLRRGAQARQTKQKARIEATHDLSGQVEDLQRINRSQSLRGEFQVADRQPKKLIEAKAVTKSFDGRLVVPSVDLLISPKSRIGFLGVNGCGKSTLIQLLLREITPDSGEVVHAEKLQVAYFEQNRDSLDPKLTLCQTLCAEGDHVQLQGRFVHVRSYLSRFLFRSEQMDMKIDRLSGGEKGRLLLAKLMLQPANILVLDEPTNDLDLETLDVLTDLLTDFDGAVLLVSHDRYFLDQVTEQLVVFGIDQTGAKKIEKMVGVEQWQSWQVEQEKIKARLQAVSVAAPPVNLSVRAEIGPTMSEQKKARKLSYKEQRELDSMESEIEKAEEMVQRLQQKVSDCALVTGSDQALQLQEVSSQLANAQAHVETLYRRWEELSSSG